MSHLNKAVVKKRKRREPRSTEASDDLDLDSLLEELNISNSPDNASSGSSNSLPPPETCNPPVDELDDLDTLLMEVGDTLDATRANNLDNLLAVDMDDLDALLTEVDAMPDVANEKDDPPHQALLSTLHGAINEYSLPPRVAPSIGARDDDARMRELQAVEPAPIEMSVLLPEEDEQEIRASRLVYEGGCSMTKTANRIKRGMQERTTRAYDTSPAQVEQTIRQWTAENRFGDHESAEMFNAAHTICGVHSMSQPEVRRIIDPVAPALGSLVYERQMRSEPRTTAAPVHEAFPPTVPDKRQEMETLEDEINGLLKEIDGYALNDSSDNIGGATSTTRSSDETPFAHNGPAYSRNYYTNDETMEELNRALRQMAANAQQNMRMDPLRERHNTFTGVFQPAVNNYLERLLMETPQPTPGQKSWEITNGVMLSHGICLSRAVFDMYLCAPTRGQRACSAGTMCLAPQLYGVQSMPPLREFDALNLMEQMGEPECTPEALQRCYDQRRSDAASGVRQRAAAPTHQLCVMCIMYSIAKAHMSVLNSNTSLPCTEASDSSSSSRTAACKPELTLARLYVRIGPGEFSKQECLFPSVKQYTGLLGPMPIITLFSFKDYERHTPGEDRPLRALRYLGHEPRQESSVGF